MLGGGYRMSEAREKSAKMAGKGWQEDKWRARGWRENLSRNDAQENLSRNNITKFNKGIKMGSSIFIIISRKLIFYDKIQQSSFNLIRLRTSGGRSNRSTNKIIIVGTRKIKQLGILRE